MMDEVGLFCGAVLISKDMGEYFYVYLPLFAFNLISSAIHIDCVEYVHNMQQS